MTDRVYSLLGLAVRARRAVLGSDSCERAIRQNKACLVIVAEDASPNTVKKFENMCAYRGIELRFYGKKGLIGAYTGKGVRSVAAILDRGFADRFMQLIDESRQ